MLFQFEGCPAYFNRNVRGLNLFQHYWMNLDFREEPTTRKNMMERTLNAIKRLYRAKIEAEVIPTTTRAFKCIEYL